MLNGGARAPVFYTWVSVLPSLRNRHGMNENELDIERLERFELPTFWLAAVNSLLIPRNLRAKKRATDPSNVPNLPKRETRVSDQQAKTRVHQTRTRGLGVRVDLVWRCLRDPKTTQCCVPVSAADRRRCPGY